MEKKKLKQLVCCILAVLLAVVMVVPYMLFSKTMHERVVEKVGKWSIEMYLDGSIKNIDAILTEQNEEKEKRYLLNIYTNITLCQTKLEQLQWYYATYADVKGESWGNDIYTITGDLLSGFRGLNAVISGYIINEIDESEDDYIARLTYANNELIKLMQIIQTYSFAEESSESENVQKVQDMFLELEDLASTFMVHIMDECIE